MLNLYPVKVYISANRFYISESDARFSKPYNESILIEFVLIGLNDIRLLCYAQGISSLGHPTYHRLSTAINQI